MIQKTNSSTLTFNLLFHLQEASPFQIPIAVNNIIGKECIFQLKLTARNIDDGQFTVMKVTESKAEAEVDPNTSDHERKSHPPSITTKHTKKRNAGTVDEVTKNTAGTSHHKNKSIKLSDENTCSKNETGTVSEE